MTTKIFIEKAKKLSKKYNIKITKIEFSHKQTIGKYNDNKIEQSFGCLCFFQIMDNKKESIVMPKETNIMVNSYDFDGERFSVEDLLCKLEAEIKIASSKKTKEIEVII